MLTPSGKVSQYFYGIAFDSAELGKAIANAAAERPGRPVPTYAQVLLLCYDYDPKTGSFALNILNAVRLGGAATVIVIASVLVLAWLRERRSRRRPSAAVHRFVGPRNGGEGRMNPDFSLFPEQASSAAPGVDHLFFFIIGVSLFFAAVTAVLLIYFALRYRRKSADHVPKPIEGSARMEVLWVGFLLALFLVMFFWGASSFSR